MTLKYEKAIINSMMVAFFACILEVITINGITELAKLLKERENSAGYSPMLGTVIELPNIKIRLGEKVVLNTAHIKSCVCLDETDEEGRYVNLGRDVILLPYADNQNFFVVGVIK